MTSPSESLRFAHGPKSVNRRSVSPPDAWRPPGACWPYCMWTLKWASVELAGPSVASEQGSLIGGSEEKWA